MEDKQNPRPVKTRGDFLKLYDEVQKIADDSGFTIESASQTSTKVNCVGRYPIGRIELVVSFDQITS